ncbi:hypothetical protein [Paenibacillus gorillae]|uniref:hypothetical protein n=1 Tax=Paenibacillus gorillae TaxID=1243662 RepID=UPI0004BCECA8|nr:hypothetical protein [Paenibacillus gorillae]
MDLNVMVNNALAEMSQSGFVEQAIKKTLEKTVTSVVDDLIGGYRSDFKTSLENHVKENLNVNMDKLNLSGYNVLLLNSVQEILDEQIQTEGIARVREELTKLFSPLEKKEWKLSEIIEKMKEEENDDGDKNGDYISFHCDDSFTYGIHVYFDPESDKSNYRCKYNFYLSREKEEPTLCKLSTLKIDDKELDNKKILNGLYGFDKFLFQLYATGATIVADCKDVEEYYDCND